MKPLALVLALVLGSAGVARAGEWPEFRELRFPAGARIMDRVLVDMDGDGAKDLLLVRGREVSLFLQKGGGFLPERPDQKFNFVDRAILWTFGDVDGDGRPEILFLTDEGVSYYKWEGGRLSFIPKTLIAAPAASILRVASGDEIRQKDFYQDLNGDGLMDLLLPGDGCYMLFRGKGGTHQASGGAGATGGSGGFLPADVIRMRPEVFLDAGGASPTSQAVSSFWYPQALSGDFDGDKRRDIFIHQRDRFSVFLQRPDGGFGPEPTMSLPLEFEGPLDEGRFKLDFQLPTKIADVDGDGISDIIATHIGRATTYVFRGRKDRRDLKKPDVILKLRGLTFLDFLIDLDHDGRQDLILARTDRPGLWDLLKVLVTKEIPVEVLFFYSTGTSLYAREPDDRREVKIPLLFSSARRGINVGTSAVITLLGDFTGDGLNDLLLRSADDRLAVYAGLKGRGFTEDPVFEIEVANMDGYRFIEPYTDDLNGDGIADMALAYYSWDGKADRLSLLLSPGAAPPRKPATPPTPKPTPPTPSPTPPAKTSPPPAPAGALPVPHMRRSGSG